MSQAYNPTKRRSILRKNPYGYAKRRSFVARMLPLNPIGDIATPALSAGSGVSGETLTWETASDWNSAASEQGVAHESVAGTDHTDATTILKGYSYSSFPVESASIDNLYSFDEDTGSLVDLVGTADGTVNGATQGVSGLSGTTVYSFDGSNDNVQINAITTGTTYSMMIWFKTTSSSMGRGSYFFDSYDGSDRFTLQHDDGSGNLAIKGDALESNITIDDGVWHMLSTSVDNGSNTATHYRDATQKTTGSANTHIDGNNAFGSNRVGSSTNPYPGDIGFGVVWDGVALTGAQHQTLYDIINAESHLTTATKTFSGATKPDLQNLSYSLNGETVILDVIGSPGGAGEETVSQTLDGTASFDLTWSNSHTDFRVKIRLDTADLSVSPTVGRVELIAP